MFSVVVPAHDEERVVGRCLDAFWPELVGAAEVVVVPNGCTDATASVARARTGVQVAEVERGGKPGALNVGDAAVSAFPRIYLDADIVVSAATLRALATALDVPAARAAAPRPVFRVDGRPWAVRAFYRAYARTPYVTTSLIGLGVYGVSGAGRARFGAFPDLTSDDLFVQRAFAENERTVLQELTFDVEVPRTLRDLVAVRTRTAQGNRQLARSGEVSHAASTGGTLRFLVRDALAHPRAVPAVAVYCLVSVLARHRARRVADTWFRDASTR